MEADREGLNEETPDQNGSGSSSYSDPDEDAIWMREAIAEAHRSLDLEEVPVGAVVVRDGQIVGRGHNRTQTDEDPTGHAEIIALRDAATSTGHWRLLDCTLYVTLEPCAMCSGAIVLSRIPRLVFGALDPKAGMCGSLDNLVQDPRLNHSVGIRTEVLGEECGSLLKDFFRGRREEARRRRDEERRRTLGDSESGI